LARVTATVHEKAYSINDVSEQTHGTLTIISNINLGVDLPVPKRIASSKGITTRKENAID
jgi:hypothetical protein